MSEDKSLAENAASNAPTSAQTTSGQTTSAQTTSAPPAAATAASPTTPPSVVPGKRDYKGLIPIAVFALAAIVFFTISSSWTFWQNSVSVTTDDAYVRADVAPLSTRAHGLVVKTLVQDYQKVEAGQPLIELRNEDFKDRVNEAQEAVSQVQIKLDDMKSRKVKLEAAIDEGKAKLENSKVAATQLDTTAEIARTAIDEANANVEASLASIKQSESALKAATADAVKAEASRKREEALLAEESSTKEKVEQVVDEHDKAIASVDSQNAARLKARAGYLASKAQLLKARQQLASVLLDRKKADTVIKSNEAELVSRTMERRLLDGEEKQLKAELGSKNSAADSSVDDLGYTTIKAPVAGTIGELKVKPGQFVNAGTQVVTLISARPWVVANFREMQTSRIKVLDKVRIDVDALPGKHWQGHVESIAPASGAQFSLLPPDNASGNFTKITQRIPVKIVFDDSQDLQDLRPGMSVTAAVTGAH